MQSHDTTREPPATQRLSASGLNRLRLSRGTAILMMLAGAVVLTGWALDAAALKCVLPGSPPMKANTAACFLLTGLALFLMQQNHQKARHGACLVAIAVALVGLLTVSEYAFGWQLGIDHALLSESLPPLMIGNPGRMSPVAAFSFFIGGVRPPPVSS